MPFTLVEKQIEPGCGLRLSVPRIKSLPVGQRAVLGDEPVDVKVSERVVNRFLNNTFFGFPEAVPLVPDSTQEDPVDCPNELILACWPRCLIASKDIVDCSQLIRVSQFERFKQRAGLHSELSPNLSPPIRMNGKASNRKASTYHIPRAISGFFDTFFQDGVQYHTRRAPVTPRRREHQIFCHHLTGRYEPGQVAAQAGGRNRSRFQFARNSRKWVFNPPVMTSSAICRAQKSLLPLP